MNLFSLTKSPFGNFITNSKFRKRLWLFQNELTNITLHTTKVLPSYYSMNEKIWLEGLLIDWLQKSIFDKWTKRFLVHSSYLFSERVVFDFVVRFYIDYIVWPFHKNLIFDFKSISNILLFLIIGIVLIILLMNLTLLANFFM
jgi:hypothetical protein